MHGLNIKREKNVMQMLIMKNLDYVNIRQNRLWDISIGHFITVKESFHQDDKIYAGT